jgi:hypothetical protein
VSASRNNYFGPIHQQVKDGVDADSDIGINGDDVTIRFTAFEGLRE